jgi:aminopeptidase N
MRSFSALVVFLLTSAAAAPAVAQRLPRNVTPDHYDLTVTPDLGRATFGGDETIRVVVQQSTTEVTLNAAEVTFDHVTITQHQLQQRAAVATDAAAEQATFRVTRALEAGPATIHIRYRGVLNDQLRGFYLSKTERRRYAVTQLEATDARRMFPCFDEPSFKATFSITATIDAADHAISNGAVVSDTPGPTAGTHTVVFDTTPRMSTYLVALAGGKCGRDPDSGLRDAGQARPHRVRAESGRGEHDVLQPLLRDQVPVQETRCARRS